MQLGQIHKAAVSCFARQGFAATGIRELGAAVGLNSATLYHYVGGKQELLLGVIRNCLDAMIDGAQDAIEDADPAQRLAALVAFHVGFTATNPQTARVAEYEMRSLSGEHRAAMQSLRDEYEQLFTDALADGERAGLFHAPDAGMARLAIMEMGTGVSHWYRPDGRLSLAEVQLNFISLAMRILAVPDEFPLPPQQLPVPQVIASEPTSKD
ncbi:TetR/AcrR family transcriptional regulator [Glutamicibacter mysorens]|uniref:TetR/AcrR family transcriptional regulator n=1 Tax=Glutamicibacter mysorens TaxID=257984 RepID=UPI0020C63C6F|nr:TetR/AcrR family transcriptional regulator [Glutamicibacter mysorens]UTM45817.1 TetR/AcrR family transcriptional regulator [Glutamicibacter mysorens]